MDYNEVLREIGGFGRFQWMLFFSLNFFSFQQSLELHTMIMAIHSPTFECITPYEAAGNSSSSFVVNITKSPDQCSYQMNGTGPPILCQQFKYDKTFFENTIVTEFDLVCDKSLYSSHIMALFLMGSCFGTLCGNVSDRIGRRKAIWFCVGWIIVIDLLTALVPSLHAQIVLRFLQGCNAASLAQSMILLAEMTQIEHRERVTANFWILSSIAYMVTPLFAYLGREWRQILLYVCLVNVFAISVLVITPESPRWLLLTNKRQEATKTFKRIAKINRRHLPESFYQKNLVCQDEPTGRIVEFFIHRNVLIKTLVICVVYWSLACTWGAFLFDLQIANSNIYLNVFLMGLVDLPSSPTAGYITEKFNRKSSFIGYLLVTSFCVLVLPFLKSEVGWKKWAKLILALVGKLTSSSTEVIGDIMRAELFPTSLRSAGFSLTEAVFVAGLMANPYINKLADFGFFIPSTVYVIQNVISMALIQGLLPETRGLDLVDTAEEANLVVTGKELEVLTSPRHSLKNGLHIKSTDTSSDRDFNSNTNNNDDNTQTKSLMLDIHSIENLDT